MPSPVVITVVIPTGHGPSLMVMVSVTKWLRGRSASSGARAGMEEGEASAANPGSTKTTYSVDEAWGLTVATEQSASREPRTLKPHLSNDTFNVHLQDSMKVICQKFGGPRQYLEQLYNTVEARKVFAAKLFDCFPPLDTVKYHVDKEFPAVVPGSGPK